MDNCPVHNEIWKIIPAGISKKTGKSYNAFTVCPIRDCTERPEETTLDAPPTRQHEEIMDALRKSFKKLNSISDRLEVMEKEVKNINALVAGALVAREKIPQKEIAKGWEKIRLLAKSNSLQLPRLQRRTSPL